MEWCPIVLVTTYLITIIFIIKYIKEVNKWHQKNKK